MNNLKVEFIDGSIAILTSYTYTESGIHIHSGTIIENAGEPCSLDLGEHICEDHEYSLISVLGDNGDWIVIVEPDTEDDLPADFWDQHTDVDWYYEAAYDAVRADEIERYYERS